MAGASRVGRPRTGGGVAVPATREATGTGEPIGSGARVKEVWRPALLQVVQPVQAGPLPSLPRLPVLHSPHGPPLPVDRELRRLQEPQVLPPPRGVCVVVLRHHCRDPRQDPRTVEIGGDAAEHPFRAGHGQVPGVPRSGLAQRVLAMARVAHVAGLDDHRVLRAAALCQGWRLKCRCELQLRGLGQHQGCVGQPAVVVALADRGPERWRLIL
mmetsp:Transcript_41624/g.120170  ORF Transcript_41624/g.120170 Transcript_41624/m.120170 type:complete len:213 (-) Transcript_41624:198-836(-)